MWWSARASLNTYMFALFGAALALANGVPVATVVFLMAFSNVQLVEYAIWRDMKAKHTTNNNRLLSLAMAAVIASEPVASIAMIKDVALRVRWWVAYAAFLSALLVYFAISQTKIDWSTGIAPNGHLEWKWLTDGRTAAGLFALAVWVGLLLVPLFVSANRWAFAFGAFTLIVSVACVYTSGTIASMWCWLAALAWFFVVAACLVGSGSACAGL